MRPALALALLALTACANTEAPTVQAAPLHDTRDALGPYLVSAVAEDNRGVAAVRAYYRAEEAPQAGVVLLDEVDPGRWQGELPGYPGGTTVHWFVEVEDVDGNLAYDPPEAELGDAACVDALDPEAPVPDGGAAYCFTVLR